MKKLIITLRCFKRTPGLIFINVLCMALGLLAAGIIAGYVYREFNYDGSLPGAGRIFRVIQNEGENRDPYTYAPLGQSLVSDYPEVEKAARVSFFYGYLACTAGKNKFNEHSALFADPGFFELFSFPMVRGSRSECLRGPNSAVISQGAARKYFGDDDPMGKTLRIGDEMEFTIDGVYQDFRASSNFRGDLVLPLEVISRLTQVWIEPSWNYASDIHTFILCAGNQQIDELSEQARNQIPRYRQESEIEILFQPLSDIHTNRELYWESGPQVNVKYLYILLIAAMLILGISMVNFLFLYTGIASQRSADTGIRKVFGASRSILFLDHFREVALLVLFSGILAVVFYAIYREIHRMYYSFLPLPEGFNARLALLLAAILLAVTFLSGFYPSLILSGRRPDRLFHHQKPAGKKEVKLVNVLVTGQFTICIILILLTLTMHKQTRFMMNRETGYASDELISIPLNMHIGAGIYSEKFGVFTEELKNYPGIVNVTMSFSSPSSVSTSAAEVSWGGKPEGLDLSVHWESVSFDYFETLGVPIKEGRSFTIDFPGDEVNWDTRRGAYILNEKAVTEMGLDDPLGKEFMIWDFKGPVVGVAGDYNFKSLHSEIEPIVYMMNPFYLNEILIRTDPYAEATEQHIEAVWNKFVPDYPLEINYVADQVQALYRNDMNLSGVFNLFSLLAILIACLGLFTLTVLTVNQRIREIGIRKVHGAAVPEILAMLNGEYLKWVVLACLISIPVAWFVIAGWLDNFAYKAGTGWWPFAFSGVSVLLIASVTVSWQSWKAATGNPAEVLKYE